MTSLFYFCTFIKIFGIRNICKEKWGSRFGIFYLSLKFKSMVASWGSSLQGSHLGSELMTTYRSLKQHRHSLVFNQKMQNPPSIPTPVLSDPLASAIWKGEMPDYVAKGCLPEEWYPKRESKSSRNKEFRGHSLLEQQSYSNYLKLGIQNQGCYGETDQHGRFYYTYLQWQWCLSVIANASIKRECFMIFVATRNTRIIFLNVPDHENIDPFIKRK